jgi:pimeloyl-ACP methyl ester carboxylesterase
MHPQTIQINDLELAWYEGRSEGTPIVFVHGNSLSSEIFSEQFADPVLADNYRLIALDLPGHGESGHSKDPVKDYSLSGLIDHFLAFIEKMELEKAVFVGHSLGGHLLIEAYPKLKERVRGMVVMGTPPFTLPPQLDKSFLDNDAQFLIFQEDLTEEEIHQFASACVREGYDDPELLMNVIRQSDPGMRAGLGHSFSKGEIQDESGIIAGMEEPLAIFHGKEDQLVNDKYFDEINTPTLWRGGVQYIDRAGHCPQLENPVAFDQLLDEFVKGLK